MKIVQRKKRDMEIAKFLCTITGYKPDRTPLYQTIDEASDEFGLSSSQVARIKPKVIVEVAGERKVKDAM